jgi:hypothetical protein
MGIVYNKEFQSKDQRITHSSPRDRQIKQIAQISNTDQSLLIEELRSQISKLQGQLEKRSDASCGYTAEQVDEEIIKAVKAETLNLKTQHEIEKNKLQSKIESLEDTIKNNNSSLTEEKIMHLLTEATKNLSSHSGGIIKSDRPQMETVFVDPAETDGKIEHHINIIETSLLEKEDMNSKVSKLKGLLGKLPNKSA